jgi:hypothetical protein
VSKAVAGFLFSLLACIVQAQTPGWTAPDPEANWYWQLENEGDIRLPFDVFEISLYDVTTEYIGKLKQRGVYVICYFSAGTSESYNPDRVKFTAENLGKTYAGYPDEIWVDINSANVRHILQERLAYASHTGCDAVEPDNVNFQDNDTGFKVSKTDQLKFLLWLAQKSHGLGMAIGLKNNLEQAVQLQPYFDFAVNEQCFQYDECDQLSVFTEAGKAVFHAEYDEQYRTNEQARKLLCREARKLNFRTLILNEELDGSYFYSCDLMMTE